MVPKHVAQPTVHAQVVVDKVTGTMLADAKSNLTAKVFDTFNLNRRIGGAERCRASDRYIVEQLFVSQVRSGSTSLD